MKTIEINLYGIHELSNEATLMAYNKWLEIHEYFSWEENYRSLNEFEKNLPILIKDVDGHLGNLCVKWRFTEREEVEELRYMRLHKYIINNYWTLLFKPAYIRCMQNRQLMSHPYIKPMKASNGDWWYNIWRSKNRLTRDCNLTGYYMDEAILDPIYKFLESPEDIDFRQLVGRCIDSWEKAVEKDYEYCTSLEYFKEEMEANEIEFTEDGRIY